MIAVPIAVAVAIVVCIPILIATLLIAYAMSVVLRAVGVPAFGQGLVILMVGLGGGLVLGFLALLRISRRPPSAIRALLYDGGPTDDPEEPIGGRDPVAVDGTLLDRVAPIDAKLAVRPGSPDDPDPAAARSDSADETRHV